MKKRKPRRPECYVHLDDGAAMLEDLAARLRAKGGKPCLVDVRVNFAFWYAEEGAPILDGAAPTADDRTPNP